MKTRNVVAGTVALAAFIGGSLGLAARASADGAVDFAGQYGFAVCETLDRFPSFSGIEGIALAIVSDGYLSFYDAGRAIRLSVEAGCPEHSLLLDRYVAANTSPAVKR